MTGLQDIPTTSMPPIDARASAVVARIRAIRPGRRAVLRGLLIGAATATLVPLDWYLSRREAGAAPPVTEGNRSEYTDCRPTDYQEEASNWWDAAPAVCYGGWRRGSYPCEGGYHREGTHAARGETYTSTRLTSSCTGRNAWRWKGYRCSDAVTTATYGDGTEFTGTTIAACALPDAERVDEPEQESTPDTAPPPRNTAPSPSDSDDPSNAAPTEPTGDPSTPRRGGLLPGLGSALGL